MTPRNSLLLAQALSALLAAGCVCVNPQTPETEPPATATAPGTPQVAKTPAAPEPPPSQPDAPPAPAAETPGPPAATKPAVSETRPAEPAPSPTAGASVPAPPAAPQPTAPQPSQPAAAAGPSTRTQLPRSITKPPSQPKAPTTRAPTAATPVPETPSTVTAPAAKAIPPPPLDLNRLKEELTATKAIGFFSKLTLKNQMDDLLDRFRRYHLGERSLTVIDLRRSYELLVMKVLSMVQDEDQKLAAEIVSSREAIWGLLADPNKFATLEI